MNNEDKRRREFGDWQTPFDLAQASCTKLIDLGIKPDIIIEPTCGVGAYILAAKEAFPEAGAIHGYEINQEYLDALRKRLVSTINTDHVYVHEADFFPMIGKPH